MIEIRPANSTAPTGDAPVGASRIEIRKKSSEPYYENQVPVSSFEKPPAPIAPEMGAGTIAAEGVKGLARGTLELATSIGGAGVEAAGQVGAGAYDIARAPQTFPGMTPEQFQQMTAARQAQTPTPNPFEGQTQFAQQVYQADRPSLQPDPRTSPENAPYLTTQWGVPQIARLAGEAGSMVPAAAATIGAAAATGGIGPAGALAGGAMGGAIEGLSEYQQVLESGGKPADALRAAAVMGAGSGALNAIPFVAYSTKFLPKGMRNSVGKAMISFLAEGATETAEGGVSAISRMNKLPKSADEWAEAYRKVEQGVIDESNVFLVAGLMGGGTSMLSKDDTQPKTPPPASTATVPPTAPAPPAPPAPVDALRPGPNTPTPNAYASFDEDSAPWVPREPPVAAPEATNAPVPIVPEPEQQVAPEAPVEQLSPEYQALLDENPELAALLKAANQQPTAEQTALEQSILGQDLIDSREAKPPVEVRKPAPPLIEARPALDVGRPVEEQAPKQPWEMTREEFTNVETTEDVPSGQAGNYSTKTKRATIKNEFSKSPIVAHEAAHKIYDGVQNITFASAFENSPEAFRQFLDTSTGKSYTNFRNQGPNAINYDWQEAIADLYMERSLGRLDGNSELLSVMDEFDGHRNSIKKALSEGKTIPPEVLADYPDLSPPEPQTARDKFLARVSVRAQDRPRPDANRPTVTPEPTNVRATLRNMSQKDEEQQNIKSITKIDSIIDSIAPPASANVRSGANDLRSTIYDTLGIEPPATPDPVTGLVPEDDVLVRIGTSRLIEEQGKNIDSPKVLEAVTKAIVRRNADAQGVDADRILGPESALTDAGKQKLVEDARVEAQSIIDTLATELTGEPTKPAATFKGMQPRPRGQEPIPLYNIPDGKGGQTTVSAETAAAQGYSVPEPPVEAPKFSKSLQQEIDDRVSQGESTPDQILEDLYDQMDDPDTIAYDYRDELRRIGVATGAWREISQSEMDRTITSKGAKKYDFKLNNKFYVAASKPVDTDFELSPIEPIEAPTAKEKLAAKVDAVKGGAQADLVAAPDWSGFEKIKDRVRQRFYAKYSNGEPDSMSISIWNPKRELVDAFKNSTKEGAGKRGLILDGEEYTAYFDKKKSMWDIYIGKGDTGFPVASIEPNTVFGAKATSSSSKQPTQPTQPLTASANRAAMPEQREGTNYEKTLGAIGDTLAGNKGVVADVKPKKKTKVGDIQDVMGIKEATAADIQTIDGVDYELWQSQNRKDLRAAIRIYDADSQTAIGTTGYPSYEAAANAYDAILKPLGGKPSGWVMPTKKAEKPTTQEKVQALREKAKPAPKRKAPSKWLGGMDVAEDTKDKTLAALSDAPQFVDDIAKQTGLSLSDTIRDLTFLELSGKAAQLPGKRFVVKAGYTPAPTQEQPTPAPKRPRQSKRGGDEAGYVNMGAIKEIKDIVFEAATKPVVFEQGFGPAKLSVAERRAKLKSFELRGKLVAMDFDNGFRKLYKRLNPGLKGKLVNRFASIPDKIVNQLNDYLEQADPDMKADALMELPPELREPAVKMRELVDNMTDYMLSLGIVEDEQGMAFADNKGVYLRRTYDIFTDPDFRERRDPRLKETLRKWLQKEYPEYSKEEINGIITDLDGTGLSATSTNNMIARGKALGQMDRRTLGRREDIPQEVMDFWGVSKNGYDRFLDTINSQAHVIANYEFLSNMAENLDGVSVATASTLRDIKRGEYTGDNADEIMSWPYLNDADTARSIRRMSRRRESVSNKEQAIATALEKLGKLPDSQKKTEMVEKLRDDALMLKLGLKRDKAGVMSVDPENLEAAAAYLEAMTAEVSSLGKKKGKDATKLRKDLDKYTRQYNKAEGDAATDENLPNMFGSFGPLAGARIHPDLKKALQDALAIKERSEFVDALRGINSQMKQNVTTRNPASAVRNLTSGFDFSMANGWILYGNSTKRLKEAMKVASVDITRAHDPNMREEYLRAVELGVAGDTVVIGDITATAANAKKPKKIRDFIRKYPEIAAAMGGPDAVAQKLYQAGDDVFKIFGWLTEKEHLMDIGMSEREAELEAAARVRRQFPTYSELPKWAQWFKASPVVGPFVAYKTETYRTAYNTVVQAVTEVKSKDPKVRRMGYRRLAGIGAASISRNALKVMLFAAFAIDPDDEDAIQMAAPVFYQDHTLGIVEADKAKGLYEGYNLSTSDAYNVLKEPMYAALRGEGVGETVGNAAWTIGRDYISAEMGTSLAAEIIANLQGKSSTIYKRSDTTGEKSLKMLGRVIMDVGVPGGARGFLKAETPEDYINETVTQFTGLKTIKIDMPNDLLYKARALTAIPREQATDVYKQIRAKDIAGAKAEIAKVNQTHKEQFMVVHKAYRAYASAGTRTDLLDDALKQAGLSQKSIDNVKYGQYEDWAGSKPMKEAMGE